MKPHKTIKLALFSILVALIVTACVTEDRYRWQRATLNVSTLQSNTPPFTNSRGEFNFNIDIYPEDIAGVNVLNGTIGNVNLFDTNLFISPNDYIRMGDEFDIRVSADRVAYCDVTLKVDRTGYALIVDNYDGFARFMQDVSRNVAYRKVVKVNFSGKWFDAYNKPVTQSIYFDLTLNNNLDIEIGY